MEFGSTYKKTPQCLVTARRRYNNKQSKPNPNDFITKRIITSYCTVVMFIQHFTSIINQQLSFQLLKYKKCFQSQINQEFPSNVTQLSNINTNVTSTNGYWACYSFSSISGMHCRSTQSFLDARHCGQNVPFLLCHKTRITWEGADVMGCFGILKAIS